MEAQVIKIRSLKSRLKSPSVCDVLTALDEIVMDAIVSLQVIYLNRFSFKKLEITTIDDQSLDSLNSQGRHLLVAIGLAWEETQCTDAEVGGNTAIKSLFRDVLCISEAVCKLLRNVEIVIAIPTPKGCDPDAWQWLHDDIQRDLLLLEQCLELLEQCLRKRAE